MICSNCKREIVPNASFCSNCGAKINNDVIMQNINNNQNYNLNEMNNNIPSNSIDKKNKLSITLGMISIIAVFVLLL